MAAYRYINRGIPNDGESGIEVLRLNVDYLRRVVTFGVPSKRLLVEFQERVPPAELVKDLYSFLTIAENAKRPSERLDRVELKRRSVVYRVRSHEKRERTMEAIETERFGFGSLPGTIERDETPVWTGIVF